MKKLDHSLSVRTLRALLEAGDLAAARRLLSALVEHVFLAGIEEFQFEVIFLLLDHGLECDGIRIFEETPTLRSCILGSGQGFSAQRIRACRYGYARLLTRAGYVGRACRVVEGFAPVTPHEFLIQGYFKICSGDLAAGVPNFKRAWELDPNNILNAGSYFHALANAEGHEAALQGLDALLVQEGQEQLRDWLLLRKAEALRLAGRLFEARELLLEIRGRLFSGGVERALGQKKGATERMFVAHALGSAEAALGQKEAALAHFQIALNVGLEHSKGYINLVFVLNRMGEAGVLDAAGMNLLRALEGRIAGHRLPASAQGRVDTQGRDDPGTLLQIDLGRDEYRSSEDSGARLGCPLELLLVAWCRLLSPVFSAPRSLLVELLWPGSKTDTQQLQGRLTKLIQRAERQNGFQLRPTDTTGLALSPSSFSRVRVVLDPARTLPSYFENCPAPSVAGFSAYYQVSERQGRTYLAELRAAGRLSVYPGIRSARAQSLGGRVRERPVA